ncbi:uncharacterized protein LOC132576086 isoform X2 [Heteronotia binoei]|uniref:uncharacterized protein LOC132576086 isoform X2 n=1 Tax=Heteronotia binoei TaxID=13085 RepID=UPI00292DB93A|nr:uncharacterized protein LOC132576086 isoform X2 [Heteronotia binoei]
MNEVACAQTRAQTFLLMALSCERAIHWHEAIEYYRQLLKVLSKDKLPEEYVPGPLYTQLLFETCYHLGIAFQKLDSHRNAVEEFTNAIEFAQVPKYACQVGCVSRSFFHTPVFARRAYAYVKCDKIKEAIKDANKTVELDPSNPDVYCIRALVWGSTKEKRRALVDLNNSLKLNSSHICSLILRGAILNSLTGVTSPMHNKDHRKAFSLCPDSQKFFDVQDFNSPKMSSFYDRYLWSLNAFHTVTEVNLFSGAAFHPKLPYSPYRSRKLPGVDGNQSRMKEPFRCGSVTVYPDETSLLRRKIYSKSLRSDLD